MARIPLAVIALVAAATLAAGSTPSLDDDYSVYVDFMRQQSWGRVTPLNVKINTFVVVDSTSARSSHEPRPHQETFASLMAKRLPGVDSSAIRSFEERNANSVLLNAGEFRDLTVVAVPRDSLDRLLHSDRGWRAFYDEYPDAQGILTLSRVGFSDDRRQALLCYESRMAVEGGGGELVQLLFDGHRWVITERLPLWEGPGHRPNYGRRRHPSR
jgi:hypothetical protein